MIDFHRLRQTGILLNKQQLHVNPFTRHCSLTHHTPQHQQMPPTCLILAVAASLLLFALRIIRRLIARGARARQVGVRRQVTTGNKRAHVDVVGEDVVTDKLAEEQDQVGELHTFTFIPRLCCRGGKSLWIIYYQGSLSRSSNKYTLGYEMKGIKLLRRNRHQ